MTATIEVAEVSQQQLAALPTLQVTNNVSSTVRRIVSSTTWQSRFVLTVEFVAFGASLGVANRSIDEPVFMLAFFVAYALATMSTYRWRARLNLSVLDDLPRLVVSLAAAAGIAYWVAAGVGHWAESGAWNAPRPRLVALAVAAALLALVLAKVVSYILVRVVRASASHQGEAAVVLGSGRDADFLIDRIQTHREYGLRLAGHVEPQLVEGDGFASRRYALERALAEHSTMRTLLVTEGATPDIELMPLMRAAVARGCHVYYVPRFAALNQFRLNAEAIWGLPLHSVSAPGGTSQRVLKRALDVVVSGTAGLLLAPVLLVIGLLIRRETGGSILFRQRRVGRFGREFDLLKFQTLVPRTLAEGDTGWNISNDDRLGPLGRLLRATSIDELPQLWNVLRGDMSLVGPRPERPHFVKLFSERYSHYADRHRVPVGLTGWAQIHRLRGDTSIDDRARFDNAYCDQWSVWSDVKIIMKTVGEVFRHSGG
jgi:exopolysaccharide biosynthesis polyprenyl glycosylphosphotransferase